MQSTSHLIFYHIAYEPQSGVWTLIRNLIKEQVKCGYQSSCVVYYSDKAYYNWITRKCELDSIVIHLIKIEKSRFSRLMILFNSGLTKFINSQNFDKDVEVLLTLHDAHFSATYLPFWLRNKFISLIVFHGCPNGLIHTNYLKLIVHLFFNVLLLFSKVTLIAVSDKDVELIRKRLYLSKKRFKTIYNGVPSAIRKVINKDKKEFIVGFIGTLDTRKQWWIAVEAIIEANKYAQNIILKIAGDGPDTILFKEKISQNPNYFNYVGNISDPINNFYNDVDLIMMTSSLEGLPMVILEAFSLGIPVISTPVGGIPEIVTDGYNGFLIEENPICFAEKIAYLSTNSSVMDELSKNALSSFAENFTIDKCSENYINTFLSKKING